MFDKQIVAMPLQQINGEQNRSIGTTGAPIGHGD